MSVRKRGKGWQASFVHEGKRLRRQFRSEAEAHQWLRESEARAVLGHPPAGSGSDAGEETLGRAFDSTCDDVWDHRKSREQLVACGRRVVEILGRDRPLGTIDRNATRSLVSAMTAKGLSNGTVNRHLAALSKILRHAADCGWQVPLTRIPKLPERQGRVRWLTAEEEDAFVGQLQHLGRPRMAALVRWLADTGMRVGEALKVRWDDIHESDGMTVATVWESKSGSSRSVPLTKRLVRILDEMDREDAGEGPFVRVHQDSFNREWALVRERLGKGEDTQLVPHALRHTCASRLVQRGVEILVVKELLGHKTLSVTLRYAHLAPKTLRSAVGVLDSMHGGS